MNAPHDLPVRLTQFSHRVIAAGVVTGASARNWAGYGNQVSIAAQVAAGVGWRPQGRR